MPQRLYLGNIPFTATEDDIRRFFTGFDVVSIKIITDRETGRPRGFAFVELSPEADLAQVIKLLNGDEMGGRRCLVAKATEKPRDRDRGDGRPQEQRAEHQGQRRHR